LKARVSLYLSLKPCAQNVLTFLEKAYRAGGQGESSLRSSRHSGRSIYCFKDSQFTYSGMPTLEEIFSPVIGKCAWQIRRGYGSFITMEFGNPHLEVRHPRLVDGLPRVQKLFQRRIVTVVGDWHLWLQHCNWAIRTSSSSISSEETDNPLVVDECLEELNGQILLSVEPSAITMASCTMRFDLGGSVEIYPMLDEPDEDQWSLHQKDANVIFSCRNNGMIVVEPYYDQRKVD
jgi:hypothetical protein